MLETKSTTTNSDGSTDSTYIDSNGFPTIKPESLGSPSFRSDYGIKYAYLTGAMYKGIASKELVVALGRAGMMGFLGTGGLELDEIKLAILFIRAELDRGQSYGMNLLSNPEHPEIEMSTVNLYLQHAVRYIEAAAYVQITPALVRYRITGISRGADGNINTPNRVLAKVSRPEIAEAFMRPPPASIVESLLVAGHINSTEAKLAREIPVAHDICVEADSGGHTDQGNPYVLLPAIRLLSSSISSQEQYSRAIRIGAAGGIGTPESAAAAFILGADFILTGSINQCTVEAGTSEAVKDILQNIGIQDTDYAPAGDMFEIGAKVQVVKRGLLFPARANKLYQLYINHNSLSEIDEKVRQQIQNKYFKRSFESIWEETKSHYLKIDPNLVSQAEINPKRKMALIFRWYFVHSTRLAMSGSEEQRVDYQIHCGPALGAFNQLVKGSELENWRNRNVAEIGEMLMRESAGLLSTRVNTIQNGINRAV